MIKRRMLAIVALVLVSFVPAFAASPSVRPATWAVAVAAKGVDNLYRIEPDLYRSAQPQSVGFRELEALGVRTILDVESPADEGLARGSSLKLFHVPMTAFGLRDDRVLEALRIMADPANRPILVHCRQGADRTGAMVALYRVVVQGWSKEDAIREMDDGGYHHSSWWRNLDRYVAAANVDCTAQGARYREARRDAARRARHRPVASRGFRVESRNGGCQARGARSLRGPRLGRRRGGDASASGLTASKTSADGSPAAAPGKPQPVEPAAIAAGDQH